MGYPQTVPSPPPAARTTLAPDSVTSVLAQALTQFNEVESRLYQLRERIASRPDKAQETPPTQPGTLGQAMEIRNQSARLLERCNELESLL